MPFRYPISLELAGRRCVVVGGDEMAERKARALLEAEAAVAVIAAKATGGLAQLSLDGLIELIPRDYCYGDLEGAFLAIAATNDPALNAVIHKEARLRRVLLNAVDDIEHCDFAAPSIVRRGDLILTISTGGKAPALSKRLRRQLEEQFGAEYAELVELLAEVRARSMPQRALIDFDTWAARWAAAMDQNLIDLVRQGRMDEARRRALEQIQTPPGRPKLVEVTPAEASGSGDGGRVWIVGAGPGDPGLITVSGRQAVHDADVVVCDRLVDPELVRDKQVIYVGKQVGARRYSQEQINDILVKLALEGRKVVRLKGGDPFVFGRGAEEAEALGRAGVSYTVIPAPTSAIAALAAAGIPVTDRRFSSSVAIVTGHDSEDAEHAAVDFRRLACAVDTIVVLMGLGNLSQIVGKLIEGGLGAGTPSAIVANATTPSQVVVTAPLSGLAEAAKMNHIGSPAVVVVGEVVKLRQVLQSGRPVSAEEGPSRQERISK